MFKFTIVINVGGSSIQSRRAVLEDPDPERVIWKPRGNIEDVENLIVSPWVGDPVSVHGPR